ncbi:MAG: hypothetical protein IT167_06700 [Bryobacterales bacterium]|nr:hypothetical protein [Bryobacterales bacterium]
MLIRKSILWTSFMLLVPACFADQWNKKTIITINEEVMVPGAVLQPGTYVIKLVDSLSNRHIVTIMNEREDKVITTILAIPNWKLTPTGKTDMKFWETPAGNPPAIRAWFYPGDSFGQEFAYPKGLSAKIAEAAHEPVLTTEARTEAEMKEAPVTKVAPSGKEQPVEVSTYAAPARTEAPEVREEPAPAPEPTPVAAAEELPKTASPYGAFGLVGLVALTAGLVWRFAAALPRQK